MLNKED